MPAHSNARSLARTLAPAGLLAAALLAGGCSGGGGGVAGARLLAINDGDMVATAFGDGMLFGPSAAELREPDALTVIRLPLPEPGDDGAIADFAQVEVSNSTLGPPRALAVRSDGRVALVLATRGPAPADARRVDELPLSGVLTAVDIADPFTGDELDPARGLRILGSASLPPGVSSVTYHPDGDIAALVRSDASGSQIALVTVDDRGPVVGEWSNLAEFPADPRAAAATAAFSPDGALLAITALGLDRVFFYRVERQGDQTALAAWGAPAVTANYPYVGAWTPDSRFFITADAQWGDALSRNLFSGLPGLVSVIRVADRDAQDAVHERVATATVGEGPEGLAVSRDGRLVAVGNVRRAFLAANDPGFTRGGSITLLSIADDGLPTVLGEVEGPTGPTGLAFDSRGRTLLVTDFENGAVQVWAVDPGATPPLRFTGVRVGVGRGAHGVVITP